MNKTINEYIEKSEWRVKENSNSVYSYGGLKNNLAEKVIAEYCLKNMYHGEIAEAHKQHAFHIHDLGNGIVGYCAGWSLEDILLKGITAGPRFTESKPAKHFGVACGHILNHCFILTQEFAGAQAYASVDVYLAPFIKEDKLSYIETKQIIERFVFDLAQKYRPGLQSPFSNITLDLAPTSGMRDKKVIVGGKELDYTYTECQKEIDMFNLAFCEVMVEGDGKGKPFSFPIPTYSITKDFDWESEVSEAIFKMAEKTGIPYFSNFVNSDMDPDDVRSMCPLTGDTKILVRSSAGILHRRIVDVVLSMETFGTVYEVFHQGKWSKAKPVRVPTTKIYRLHLSNGQEVRMGENHLQPVLDHGTIKAKELKKGMFLPFNKDTYGNSLGDYSFGYVLGAYAGDGSHDKSAIVYSICGAEKSDSVADRIVSFWEQMGCYVNVGHSKNRAVRIIRVGGLVSGNIVEKYITGTGALDKGFSKYVYNTSVDFREGLLQGYSDTDGARGRNSIYTSSNKMRFDLLMLLSSLGRKGLANYSDTRENRIVQGNIQPNYRIDYPERDNYSNLYKTDDKYNYYSITSIEEDSSSLTQKLYCLEVENDNHLFTLANGLVTHNCRLRLDTKELMRNGGGLFGAGEKTGSIGVVTLNMPRLAYIACQYVVQGKEYKSFMKSFPKLWEQCKKLKETTPETMFFIMIDYFMDLAKKSLVVKRKEVEKLKDENGIVPYTSAYLDDFSNHFNTIGLVGVNEAIINITEGEDNIESHTGHQFAEHILKYMLENLKNYQEEYKNYYGNGKGLLFNLEATPAEGAGHKLAKYDRQFFGKGIFCANGTDGIYYTNSTQIPQDSGLNADLFDALDHQNDLQKLYTSGTVYHIYTEGNLTWEKGRTLIKAACENFEIPYYSLSPTIYVCPVHGRLDGVHETCPFDHTEEELKYIETIGGEIIEEESTN